MYKKTVNVLWVSHRNSGQDWRSYSRYFRLLTRRAGTFSFEAIAASLSFRHFALPIMITEKSRPLPDMEELVEQLHLLAAVLSSSRTRLSGRNCVLDGEAVDPELLAEFKTALDHTRHSVWALLEALAGYSGYSVEEVLQNYRMQRATELLQALRGQVESVGASDSVFARTFLDEVQIVAELALRRHLR